MSVLFISSDHVEVCALCFIETHAFDVIWNNELEIFAFLCYTNLKKFAKMKNIERYAHSARRLHGKSQPFVMRIHRMRGASEKNGYFKEIR